MQNIFGLLFSLLISIICPLISKQNSEEDLKHLSALYSSPFCRIISQNDNIYTMRTAVLMPIQRQLLWTKRPHNVCNFSPIAFGQQSSIWRDILYTKSYISDNLMQLKLVAFVNTCSIHSYVLLVRCMQRCKSPICFQHARRLLSFYSRVRNFPIREYSAIKSGSSALQLTQSCFVL